MIGLDTGVLARHTGPDDHAVANSALAKKLHEPGRMDALRTMVGLSKADTETMRAHSRVPALVVMGTRDPDFPDEAAEARWLGQALGTAPLLVDGAGHHPHLEMPDHVAPTLLRFLGRLLARRPVGRSRGNTRRAPMNTAACPMAVHAAEVPPRAVPSSYPEPSAARMAARIKRALGAVFGLANFGVNLTELAPGAVSALRHAQTTQEEFVHMLPGHPMQRTGAGDTPPMPGKCAGFRAGSGDGHRLVNPTEQTVVYLEIGDRSAGDTVSYPDDDLVATLSAGRRVFTHKDGRPY